jgi:hypothetical protein
VEGINRRATIQTDLGKKIPFPKQPEQRWYSASLACVRPRVRSQHQKTKDEKKKPLPKTIRAKRAGGMA